MPIWKVHACVSNGKLSRFLPYENGQLITSDICLLQKTLPSGRTLRSSPVPLRTWECDTLGAFPVELGLPNAPTLTGLETELVRAAEARTLSLIARCPIELKPTVMPPGAKVAIQRPRLLVHVERLKLIDVELRFDRFGRRCVGRHPSLPAAKALRSAAATAGSERKLLRSYQGGRR